MINLAPAIQQIKNLLDEASARSITYAALEARLAFERVVYDRLRQRHDYISHEQLKKWQPGGVIKQLITDVDAHVTQTMSLQIGSPSSEVQPQDDEYVELGTEIGFDAKRIEKMWNALGKLALHARLPESKDDHIPDYGNPEQTRPKVEEVLAELERLATGTMTFSGLGETVSFVCDCGEANKRRARLLKEGQSVYCINPKCEMSWKVRKEGGEFIFESETADLKCDGCGKEHHIPWRWLLRIPRDQLGSFTCGACNHKNLIQWQLKQMRRATPSGDSNIEEIA